MEESRHSSDIGMSRSKPHKHATVMRGKKSGTLWLRYFGSLDNGNSNPYHAKLNHPVLLDRN